MGKNEYLTSFSHGGIKITNLDLANKIFGFTPKYINSCLNLQFVEEHYKTKYCTLYEYYIGLSLVAFFILFVFVKYYNIKYDYNLYKNHIETMIYLFKTMPKEKFEQISFELGVKEL